LSNLSYDHYIAIFMLRFIKFLKLKVPNYFWITAGPHISEGIKYFNAYFEVFGLGGSKYFSTILKYTDRGSKHFKVFGPGEPFWGGPFFLVTGYVTVDNEIHVRW